jgi:hypothetical protein
MLVNAPGREVAASTQVPAYRGPWRLIRWPNVGFLRGGA